jgi:hypothetical protein
MVEGGREEERMVPNVRKVEPTLKRESSGQEEWSVACVAVTGRIGAPTIFSVRRSYA